LKRVLTTRLENQARRITLISRINLFWELILLKNRHAIKNVVRNNTNVASNRFLKYGVNPKYNSENSKFLDGKSGIIKKKIGTNDAQMSDIHDGLCSFIS
jgi:hypothetical protein